MSLIPSTWSAKMQVIATALVTIAVAWLNKRFDLGLDPKLILGAGGTAAAGIAVIDHGEPAETPAAKPTSTVAALSDEAKTALKAALGLSLLVALVGCAAPANTQGQAGQGGSNPAPQVSVSVNIGTGPGSTFTASPTSAPTAAPAASSTATASQHADATVTPTAALGDSAIKALAPIPVPAVVETAKKTPAPVPSTPVVPPVPEPPK